MHLASCNPSLLSSQMVLPSFRMVILYHPPVHPPSHIPRAHEQVAPVAWRRMLLSPTIWGALVFSFICGTGVEHNGWSLILSCLYAAQSEPSFYSLMVASPAGSSSQPRPCSHRAESRYRTWNTCWQTPCLDTDAGRRRTGPTSPTIRWSKR